MTRIQVKVMKDRPDARIFADARSALDRCGSVPPGVHVHVDRGILTLTGSVRSSSERSDAENAVRGVAGIQQLVNNIVIGRMPSGEPFEPPDDRG